MFLNTCPFCEHGNPADSKFCNACGGALHLLPCPRCGAVSDVTATTCYQCHGQLPGGGADAVDSTSPAAEVSSPLPRRHSRVLVGTTVLVAIAVSGYYSYRQRIIVDAPQPPTGSGEASGRGDPAGTGFIWWGAAAGNTASAKADDSARPASPSTSLPATPLASPTPALENALPANRHAVESRQSKAAAGLIARPQKTNVGKAGKQEPPRQEACTEAVAALGLCTPMPAQRRE